METKNNASTENLDEAWYDSFKNAVTAAKSAASGAVQGAKQGAKGAAATNNQKAVENNLNNMIVLAKKIQNSLKTMIDNPNAADIAEKLRGIEGELQKDLSAISGKPIPGQTAAADAEARRAAQSQNQSQSQAPAQVPAQAPAPQAAPSQSPAPSSTPSTTQAPQQNQISPAAEKIADALKIDIGEAFRRGVKSMNTSVTDFNTVFQIYKNHIDSAIDQNSLDPLKNLTKENGIRDYAMKEVSKLLGLPEPQNELEEPGLKKKIKIKIKIGK
jgi:hypothetical protein